MRRKRRGQIVDQSRSGGKTIREYWMWLLRANEIAWEARQVDEVRTDEELSAAARRAFPGRPAELFWDVARYRRLYNDQVLESFSWRYVRRSRAVSRATSRGKPLGEWRTSKLRS